MCEGWLCRLALNDCKKKSFLNSCDQASLIYIVLLKEWIYNFIECGNANDNINQTTKKELVAVSGMAIPLPAASLSFNFREY